MLPPGLVLFTPDLAFPERPMAPMLGRVERIWIGRQRAKSAQRLDQAPSRIDFVDFSALLRRTV
jgi:hypothetical protein